MHGRKMSAYVGVLTCSARVTPVNSGPLPLWDGGMEDVIGSWHACVWLHVDDGTLHDSRGFRWCARYDLCCHIP